MRQIGIARWEGYCEFGGRVHVSGQHVGKSLMTSATRVPCFHDAANLSDPRHRHCRASFKNNNCVWIRCRHLLDQRILFVGK